MKNEVFCKRQEMLSYIIENIEPRLFLPEDNIVKIGATDKVMYFLAHGELQVSIKNHMKEIDVIKQL